MISIQFKWTSRLTDIIENLIYFKTFYAGQNRVNI